MEVRYRVNSPRLVPILSQMSPLRIIPSYFCVSRFITSFPFAVRYLKWFFRFCDLNLSCALYFLIRAACAVGLLFGLITAGTHFADNTS